MGFGKGFGKVILFGEHFVVYDGMPAIVSAIDKSTTAEVNRTSNPGFFITDNRHATPGYKENYAKQQKESVERMVAEMGLDFSKDGVDIKLAGDLFVAGGIGASAASCAAIARALSDEYGLSLSDKQINELALEGDKAYAGNPSGVDNTAAVYGGLIWFQKEPPIMELMKTPEPVRIVMGNTGKVANTKVAVAGVRERKEKDPEKYGVIFEDAKKLVFDAKESLLSGDQDRTARLINRNHGLLQEIEVSSPELDKLCEIALENGALAAKMTGGGMGGYMYALTPDEELQKQVVSAMEAEGFTAFATNVGV
ncbi:MAG: mevalonate kinase [Candidatus Altiarchaeota archaeon]